MTSVTASDAIETFRDEVRRWAARIGVEAREIRVRAMKRKWASASTAGRLTFNEELLGQRQERRAEVIVHELVHLKVGNHGPLSGIWSGLTSERAGVRLSFLNPGMS
jgi:predicted metal-dependent hydrolase